MWNSDPLRFIEGHTSFAVKTGADCSHPNLALTRFHEGIQIGDAYYQTRKQWLDGTPAGAHIWESAAISEELYDLASDPFELNNKLYRWWLRPDRAQILQDRAWLKSRIDALVDCVGDECRAVEDGL
jgi:hypothetical protein